MKQLELKVITRKETGRGSNRRLRASGKLPGVIYGKKGSRPLIIEQTDFRVLWKAIAGVTALIQIDVEGYKPALSIIKEVQRDSRTDQFIHIDFHEVSTTERMQTNVAVHIIGESIGVKNEGALLEVFAHNLEIRCLPTDLPSTIDVDVSELHTGDSVHIKDLKEIDSALEVINEAWKNASEEMYKAQAQADSSKTKGDSKSKSNKKKPEINPNDPPIKTEINIGIFL